MRQECTPQAGRTSSHRKAMFLNRSRRCFPSERITRPDQSQAPADRESRDARRKDSVHARLGGESIYTHAGAETVHDIGPHCRTAKALHRTSSWDRVAEMAPQWLSRVRRLWWRTTAPGKAAKGSKKAASKNAAPTKEGAKKAARKSLPQRFLPEEVDGKEQKRDPQRKKYRRFSTHTASIKIPLPSAFYWLERWSGVRYAVDLAPIGAGNEGSSLMRLVFFRAFVLAGLLFLRVVHTLRRTADLSFSRRGSGLLSSSRCCGFHSGVHR